MAKNREQIKRDFDDDMERANRWRDTDPDRHQQLAQEANDRRATALEELADENDRAVAAERLNSARTRLATEFPRADPSAIVGASEDEMRAAAQRSQEFVDHQREDAAKSEREARRPLTRERWTGRADGGRTGVPGGEIAQPTPAAQEAVRASYERTREVIAESRKPGPRRRYAETNEQADPDDTTATMAALDDYHRLHPDSGLSVDALIAKTGGGAVGGGTDQGAAVSAEDARG